MLSKFSTVIQNAVDALAPPVPLLEDFTYHWKMVMKFYGNRESISKTVIESTNIPAHLDQLLKILLEEEASQESGTTGPCLEYLLQHRLLDLLATLACTDCPPGMRQFTLCFIRRLITQLKHPILPHVSVYSPIQRLVSLCNGRQASPTELHEIKFLCALCGIICKHPQLTNIFNSQQVMGERRLSTSKTSDDAQVYEDRDFETITVSSSNLREFRILKVFLCFSECGSFPKRMCSYCRFFEPSARSGAHSELCTMLANKLDVLFASIPPDIEPNDLDDLQVNWGFDSPVWTEASQFPGCRQVAAFFAWLDYCDQLVRESHPIISTALAASIRAKFLEHVLQPALIESETINKVLITAFITKCLKQVSAPALLTEFLYWLVGESREPELPDDSMCVVRQHLLDNCLHDQDEISLETLRLFEVLLEKNSEHVLHCLVLVYLTSRSYYDTSVSDSAIASWSDEEDEREKQRDGPLLDFSSDSSPVSRTLAPSNINKIINSFLLLLPQHLHSTTDPDESGYEQYVQDADRQYQACIGRCTCFGWPCEATFPEPAEYDDSGSSDSRPEADHGRRFYEGPFLRMLFIRLVRLPYQPYEINLQLTGLVSRLAMLPHPYLHEFLLNPLLPALPDANTLFSTLQLVANELVTQIPQMKNYKQLLFAIRQKLLGDGSEVPEEENSVLESVVVLEEFCKELAAIAFVKYHHSS
ncbi:hypothetical protein L9F63_004768 [Diploptera punctata]|uniref:FHF complex subunit HOOK-interacting protein C-terminal domain-containing protein n=1 Tax=Diploptera punctata TaxID=6984 RepID=A0AAD8E732_DIPPU|nr:hypothetical protein L9F63_004768 [Diploptera punctata]